MRTAHPDEGPGLRRPWGRVLVSAPHQPVRTQLLRIVNTSEQTRPVTVLGATG